MAHLPLAQLNLENQRLVRLHWVFHLRLLVNWIWQSSQSKQKLKFYSKIVQVYKFRKNLKQSNIKISRLGIFTLFTNCSELLLSKRNALLSSFECWAKKSSSLADDASTFAISLPSNLSVNWSKCNYWQILLGFWEKQITKNKLTKNACSHSRKRKLVE